MSIWRHEHNHSRVFADLDSIHNCIFCKAPLHAFPDFLVPQEHTISLQYRENMTVRVCQKCGWWLKTHYSPGDIYTNPGMNGSQAELRALDLADINFPIAEARRVLLARYDRRFELHPRLLEETVGDVFRDFGYRVRVTAYSNDGGIDAILDGSNDVVVGVQVKRTHRVITLEQIRAFSGALLLGGYTRGVYVTTSTFPRAANRLTSVAELRGQSIELIDSARLYQALRIQARPPYRDLEDWLAETEAPFEKTNLSFADHSFFPRTSKVSAGQLSQTTVQDGYLY